MIDGIRDINFADNTEMIPSIITMLIIPFSFSIANGIILGLIAYTGVNLMTSGMKKVSWGLIILTLLMSIKFIV